MSTLEDLRHDANMSATWAAEALRSAKSAKEEADGLIAQLVALGARVKGREGAKEVEAICSDLMGDTFNFWLKEEESYQ